ncbi:MAG: hypothetical protein ACI9DC_001830 [Gammaproteobacteria bacterium]|jgi:hypothetical protein
MSKDHAPDVASGRLVLDPASVATFIIRAVEFNHVTVGKRLAVPHALSGRAVEHDSGRFYSRTG